MTVSMPTVFVASAGASAADQLRSFLEGVDLRYVADADHLLSMSRATPPDVVVLYADLPSTVPLTDLLSMLRSRDELAHTHWLAVGSRGLGALLMAGVDALMAEGTPPQGTALQVRALLARVRRAREQELRVQQLQERVTAWEHEERVRDQLVHMLVHDLKNPISAIMGILEVAIIDSGRVPGDILDLLKLARDESQHLLHLAVNMLDVRKMQAGKMHLNRQTLFAPMLEDVLQLARADIGVIAADRHISLSLDPGFAPVNADPDILRRVFANLISNAIKHTAHGGQIEVLARQSGAELLCSVRDDGEGIPEDDLPNLFSAFEQSRLTLHSRFDTGMGLAFCKLAIEQHGGRIWVDSVRGEGSTFTFSLPMLQEEEEEFVELVS